MSSDRFLKFLIWTYFWLLIFEGALRRWVLPGLATPLLIVRDPIVIVALYLAYRQGKLPLNGFVLISVGLGLVTIITALLAGHGNLSVTLYGFRTNYLHFIFIFIVGAVLARSDVECMGRSLLIISVPMTLLMALQFYSPEGSFVNIGVGGEGDAGFGGALGYKRPPGTFSFITGPMSFYPLVAAFSLGVMLQFRSVVPKWLAITAGIATLAVIPISISRGLLISVVVVGIGAILSMSLGGRSISRLIQLSVLMGIVLIAVSFIPGLEKPREAFLSRWTDANTTEGGAKGVFITRILGVFLGGLDLNQPNLFLGKGLGMGTNVGAKLLTGGTTFLISEGEWGRITGEIGLPLGLVFIGLRVGLMLWLLRLAWWRARNGDSLPMLLWFAAAPLLLHASWNQPTIQGFATLAAGLVLTAAKPREEERLVV